MIPEFLNIALRHGFRGAGQFVRISAQGAVRKLQIGLVPILRNLCDQTVRFLVIGDGEIFGDPSPEVVGVCPHSIGAAVDR